MLDRLLSATFPGVEELRQQVPWLVVSEAYGAPDPTVIFTIDTEKAPPADVECRVPVEARGQDADGMFTQVLLHVDYGYVDELEVLRGDSYCLQREIDPFSFTVGTTLRGTSNTWQFVAFLEANGSESRKDSDSKPSLSE